MATTKPLPHLQAPLWAMTPTNTAPTQMHVLWQGSSLTLEYGDTTGQPMIVTSSPHQSQVSNGCTACTPLLVSLLNQLPILSLFHGDCTTFARQKRGVLSLCHVVLNLVIGKSCMCKLASQGLNYAPWTLTHNAGDISGTPVHSCSKWLGP